MGDCPQHRSPLSEIWKGSYNGAEVALKVISVSPDDPNLQRMKKVSIEY